MADASTAGKQQSNFPCSTQQRAQRGVLLIGKVLGEGLYSPGYEALLFRWGWVCLSLTQPVLQPECERDVWMGHRQWLFCGHTGGWSFRALQVQPVIFRAHPTCIKQAIELHAGPLCPAEETVTHISHWSPLPHSSPLNSVPCCQLGWLSCRNIPSIYSWISCLCSDKLGVSLLPF